MPRSEDINNITDYEKTLYSMTDEEFLQYATQPEMDDLYNIFSEADKTAFLIRAMMVGTNPESFYNDLIYGRTNMTFDGPEKINEITDANRLNPESKIKIQYDVYRAILYSDQNDIRELATKTTQKMTASEILEKHDRLKDVFTAHLQIPVNVDMSYDVQKEMADAAKRERDDFLKSLGFQSYDETVKEGDKAEIDAQNEQEEHVYIPLKDRPVNINAVDDYVAKEEFTVADEKNGYNITIKPLKEGEAAETLLNGYDLEETPASEKRNMLFSFTLQGMGRDEITGFIHRIQANEQLRQMYDLCVLVMDSKEIIANKDFIKKAVLSGDFTSNDSYNLYAKADAFARRKKIENPFAKKKEDNLSELDEEDSFEKEEDINNISVNNINHVNHNPDNSVIIGNKEFNIEKEFIRPEAKFGALSATVKNANVWIDEIKADYNGDPYKADEAAARILAARILVDSERGVLKSLKKPVKGTDIDDLADKLLENETFRKFLDSLGVEEKRSLLTHSGHGGVFEDKFKEYILKQKAGKLQNDRILDRFMPKAYQRIEELQKQAAKKGIGESIAEEAAEVMLIRAMIGIGRNQPDKLSAKIPTFSNLPKEVEKLGTEEYTFAMVCGMEKTIKDFQKGHGGLMIENMYNAGIGSNENTALTRDFKKYCTAKYRYEELQERANKALDHLNQNIDDDYRTLATKDSCMEAKEVLAEAVVMAMTMARDDHPNKEISPTLKNIQTGTEIIKKDPTFNRELFPNRNPAEFLKELKAFAEARDPKAYAEELFGKLRTVYMQEHPEALNKANKSKKNDITTADEKENDISSEKGRSIKPM